MSNLGPSDDKFGTFWGVQGPPGPLLVALMEVTFTQVLYIIGIVSSSPTDFHSE